MDALANRVAARKLAESTGNLVDLLDEFERAIKALEVPSGILDDARKFLEETVASGALGVNREIMAASDVAYRALAKIKNAHLVSKPGHKLFLGIIQKYTLPAALRKKVEIASRAYLKTPRPRFKAKSSAARYLEYIQVYDKFWATLQAHLEIARLAIKQGKDHMEEGEGSTKTRVGPFTIVNTGGFSEKQMGEVQEIMKKAISYAQSAGFSEILYGDVQVTNTLHRANVLAFYLIAQDELFIRANVKANYDTVQTVLHELGHRYENKFLKPGVTKRLYDVVSGQQTKKDWGVGGKKLEAPAPGDTLPYKKEVLQVVRTIGDKVYLTLPDEPNSKFTVPLATFWALKGKDPHNFDEDPNYIGFVTPYAKKGGPSENFAEMFSFYCLGRLPVLQSAPFEELVFGTEKTANQRMAHRLVARLTQ